MYELIQDEGTDTYRIALMSELPELDVQIASADILTTKNKTKVPIIVMRYPGARFTILYSHGNATDLGAMCYMFSLLANGLGVNVVGYDYTGYGVSQKFGVPPTEKQTYRDIERVYEYCLEQNLVSDPGRDLLLYGQSVGSGPSCYLASRKPVAGVILHSPIMSGLRVITDSRLLCCCDIFPNIDRIKAFKSPVFIIHGSKDEEVTVNHGQRLLEAGTTSPVYTARTYYILYVFLRLLHAYRYLEGGPSRANVHTSFVARSMVVHLQLFELISLTGLLYN